MKLSREQKQKRAQIKIDYLEARIDRETKKLRSELKEAKAELESLQQLGFRVYFDKSIGFDKYIDYTLKTYKTLSAASRVADSDIIFAENKGAKTRKETIFNDTVTYPDKEWDKE